MDLRRCPRRQPRRVGAFPRACRASLDAWQEDLQVVCGSEGSSGQGVSVWLSERHWLSLLNYKKYYSETNEGTGTGRDIPVNLLLYAVYLLV